ncbi:MAG: hypothetical protein HY565_02360 [Candidatus Kerfeldbacteria bacterium]|nr:hypothetical protein [Candidatus Kerfeldbacteria bacterium]
MKLAYGTGDAIEFDPSAGGFDNPLQSYSQLGTSDPATIVFTLVNTALIFLGMITLVLIIVAGFIWLTAAGEEEKLKKAKDIMKGATMGLLIVLGSYGLAQYLFTAIRVATQ